jgi:multicomponent Na+:H+ antiporter subunit E
MTMFVWNLLLAIGWVVLTGRFTLGDLFLGFGVGYAVLLVARRVLHPSTYFEKVWQAVTFAFFFVKELVLANLRVAHDVVTPTHHMRPGVLAIPLDARTNAEITLFANVITLTPGSMTLDVSEDRTMLYVHVMYIDDIEAIKRRIKDGFERRAVELLR